MFWIRSLILSLDSWDSFLKDGIWELGGDLKEENK